jgi:hypothetical protein
MVAVIFLDIDGVICCNMAGRLEESKLAVLNTVAKATGAKVVLSTDWRRQAQLKRQVVAALKRLDIEVIGATPMRAMFQPIRPQEINEWMHANGEKFGVTSWVAIDDRDLLNEHGGAELTGHMVRTHPNTGLTRRLGDVAIEILGGSVGGGSGGSGGSIAADVPETSKQSRLASTSSSLSATGPLSRTPTRTPASSSPSSRKSPSVPTSFATNAAAASGRSADMAATAPAAASGTPPRAGARAAGASGFARATQSPARSRGAEGGARATTPRSQSPSAKAATAYMVRTHAPAHKHTLECCSAFLASSSSTLAHPTHLSHPSLLDPSLTPPPSPPLLQSTPSSRRAEAAPPSTRTTSRVGRATNASPARRASPYVADAA